MQLCDCAVDYSRGLPLALKVFGSFLYKKSIHEWKSEFNKLKQCPNKEVYDVLKMSFGELDDNGKIYFLMLHFFIMGVIKILLEKY